MGKIRIALTISGAVSLGAYEAGVLAALLSAIGPLCEGEDPTVRLDAIGGASAGAITGLLAGRALTAGLDPVTVMEQAWVERDGIKGLLKRYQGAPFSMAALQQMATELIDPSTAKPAEFRQTQDVELVMVLTALRGLNYKIVGPAQKFDATTFVDLVRATLSHDTSVDAMVNPPDGSVVRTALASGANEMGFPPMDLDRTAAAGAYAANGITDFPPGGILWYSDGGTLDNEPLGHTLDLVGEIDGTSPGEFTRIHLLIHPHAHGAPSTTAWANPANPPTWTATLVRALSIMLTQSVYDDLRTVQKTNTRLAWLDELDEAFGAALDALPAAQQTDVSTALTSVLASIDGQRSQLPAHHRPAVAGTAAAQTPRQLLQAVVAEIAGLAEKRPTAVEVISPVLVGGSVAGGSDQLLAGKQMADFGGFLDVHLRRSDFDLGYRCALEWLGKGGLTNYGLTDADNDVAIEAANAAYTPSTDTQWQNWSAGKLLLRHPLVSLRLAWRGLRVAASALVTRRPQV